MAVLKSGSKGGPVKKLQEQLNKAGAKPKLKSDGLFGTLTGEAVKALQKKSKLKADGIVGAKTEAALGGGKGGGAGASKGGGAGGGKGVGGLPKDAVAKLKHARKVYDAYYDACGASDGALLDVGSELKRKSGLSEQEKAKLLKPLKPRFSKVEKIQSIYLKELIGIRNLTGSVDQKSADSRAKKLIKKGQAMDAMTSKYSSYCKSTKKKSDAILKKLSTETPKSELDASDAYFEIYMGRFMCSLETTFNDLQDEVKKAA